ncbi:MAG: T9SS type A sorting domain-containing protein [Rhodothermaceae bacterium]|nr:T9SS type A sorting domain-containing protein [Rhodothermaceae bacterium]
MSSLLRPSRMGPLSLALLLALLPLSTATAQSVPQARTCGTADPTDAEARASFEAVLSWMQANDFDPQARGVDPVTIPVAFHVVAGGPAITQGNIPDQWITDQMTVLNDAFLPMGFQFALASVDRTINPAWFGNLSSSNDFAMKQALNRDPSRFMNFYSARTAGGLLGWATFPLAGVEDDITQGVVVLDTSLPGGPAFPYNEGDTGTHEVGHYVGLFHTFQGGCSGGDTAPGCESGGDQVCDTPAEASSAFGCPNGRDTCPTGDVDPITNFMDYVDDACMIEFTAGQATRAQALMSSFRPTLMTATGAFAGMDHLVFDGVTVGEATTQTVYVVNLDATELEITNIASDNAAFAADAASVMVPGNSSLAIEVMFTPDADVVFAGTLTLTTADGDLTVALSGEGLTDSAGSIAEPGLLAEAAADATTTATLTISNAGLGNLSYTVVGTDAPDTAPFASATAVRAAAGGPDAYGYTWVDSDDPDGPAYDWVDISGTGTQLVLSDDGSQDVALPWRFPFYGQLQRSIRIVSNGIVTFDSLGTSGANSAMGTADVLDHLIAPFWFDLDPSQGGAIYYQDMGDGRFVVTWDQVPPWSQSATTDFYTAQAILYANGTIVFQYGASQGPLNIATVGIESEDASDGLQMAFNQAYVTDGLAVRISAGTPWITTAAPPSGAIPASTDGDVTFTFDATGLSAGVYQSLVPIVTNDPALGSLRLHAVFGVDGALTPPPLYSPAYQAEDVPRTATLDWADIASAQSYDVEVADGDDFSNVLFSTNVTASEAIFDGESGVPPQSYFWRVRTVDGTGPSAWSLPFVYTSITTVANEDEERTLPEQFTLGAAYPNPFRDRVSLPLALDEPQRVTVRAFDVTGRAVAIVMADEALAAGTHTLTWDATALPAGVYLLRVDSAEGAATQRVVLLR